jgi:uncharacterized peroxidase-related enzyme
MLEAEREDWLTRLARDWRTARLSAVDKALCTFADKLTRAPGAMKREDVDALRGAGLDDERIHDAIQVVSYFNYINRVADAVHVDLEPEMGEYPEGE